MPAVAVGDVLPATAIEIEWCDRCGARAQVVTHHAAGSLAWCGHHYHALRRALEGTAIVIRQLRART